MLLFLGSGVTLAQSTLPATSPTESPAPTPTSPLPANPDVAPRTSHPADVAYAQGQLAITADNSSLNQILHEISRLTGMAVTGGVADQRVFGKYGPAPPADILASLLEGTGSNMLLLNSASNAPAQLILTPQQGGSTPPNPNVPSVNDDDSDVPLRPPDNPPPSRPAYDPSIQPRSRSGAMLSAGSSDASASTPADPGANPPPANNPPAPNSVQTPQQIYEQLQLLQRAQSKQ